MPEVKREKAKVRNIDNFMEELRREQEAREERAKRRDHRVSSNNTPRSVGNSSVLSGCALEGGGCC